MKTLFIQKRKWLYLKKKNPKKNKFRSRGASEFPWFSAGAQTLLGALSTSELSDGHRAGLNWLACDTSKCWLAAIVGVRCFMAIF